MVQPSTKAQFPSCSPSRTWTKFSDLSRSTSLNSKLTWDQLCKKLSKSRQLSSKLAPARSHGKTLKLGPSWPIALLETIESVMRSFKSIRGTSSCRRFKSWETSNSNCIKMLRNSVCKKRRSSRLRSELRRNAPGSSKKGSRRKYLYPARAVISVAIPVVGLAWEKATPLLWMRWLTMRRKRTFRSSISQRKCK